MNESLKRIIEETLDHNKLLKEKSVSQSQRGLIFSKRKQYGSKKNTPKKWKWIWNSDWENKGKLPKRKKPEKTDEEEVDEVVDADGNIQTGDKSNDFNVKGVTSPKTSDEYARAVGGQMGGAGLDGGGNAARLMRYFGEEDMSKVLGAETIEKDLPYDDAKEHFEDELEVPEDEIEDRLKELGYESDYAEGVLRLVENPKEYVRDYLESILSKKTNINDVVEKDDEEKTINPIIKKQIDVLKQTLKDNGISTKQFLSYIKNNE